MSTRVIAFANQKGGVGKTTTAINLAACCAERNKRVLLIDLDPQANATSGLGLEKEEGGSIYHLLLGQGHVSDYIRPSGYKRLDVLPSEVDLAGAEIDVARSERYLHRFQEAIAPLHQQQQYDLVFVDCPPSLGILTMNALAAADSIVIPLQCEYFALEGLSVISRLVEQIRENGANPQLHVEGIIMTMYDMRTNLSQQVVQEVCAHFGDRVYETLIPRSVRLSEAPSYGKPVIAYDKNSTGAAAYRQLAREFIARQKQQGDPSPPFAPVAVPASPPPRQETPPTPAAPVPEPEPIRAPEAPPQAEPRPPEPGPGPYRYQPDHRVW